VRMEGNSFDVTREYLTYHEEKNAPKREVTRRPEGRLSRVLRVWTEDGQGHGKLSFRAGETLVLNGTLYEPDDRAPVVLFGVVRADGTSVYGSHSSERGFEPARTAPREFSFAVRFEPLQLLPGKYRLRVHVLDAEGLRMFDTMETDVVVTGETRDYGVVELPHRWLPGPAAAPATATAGVQDREA